MSSINTVNTKKIFGALKWTVANAVLQLITKISTLVILSRVLSPTDFGIYNVGHAIAIMAATLAQYGAATNLIYLKEIDKRTGAAAIFIAAIGSLLATAIIFLSYYCLFHSGEALGASILAFSLYISVQATILVYEALAKRDLKFRSIAISELIASLAGNLLVTLAFAMAGFGFWSLVIGQFVYGLVRLVLLAYSSRASWGFRFGRKEIAHVTSSSWAITLAEFANMATVYSQRPIVGAGLGADAAGLWSRFYQIVLIQLTALVQPIDNLVLPVVARKREHPGSSSTISLIIEVISIVTIPISVFTIVISPIAIPIVFGEDWISLVIPMQIGAITLFFRGIDRVLLSAARATGRMRVRAACQWIQLILVTSFIVISLKEGLTAVALAYVLAQAAALIINVILFGKDMGIPRRNFLGAIAPAVAFSLISAIIIYAGISTLNLSLQSKEASLIGVAAITIASTALFVFRRRVFSQQLNDLLTILLAKIGGRYAQC